MAIQANTGKVQATITNNVPDVVTVSPEDLTTVSDSRSSDGTTTLYTCPADTVAYISMVSCPTLTSAQTHTAYIAINGHPVVSKSVVAVAYGDVNAISFVQPIKITATQTVTLTVANYASGAAWGVVSYWEEAV